MSQRSKSHTRSCDACGASEEVHQRPPELKEGHDPLFRTNATRNPLQVMPTEVLSSIFEQTLDDRSSTEFGPLGLGLICRHWRQVAWATPSLWNNLMFFLDRTNSEEEFEEASFKARVEIFQGSISRSRALPLSISILNESDWYNNTAPSDAILLLIEVITRPVVMSRIAHLHLSLPKSNLLHLTRTSIPLLKRLEFFGPNQDFANIKRFYASTDVLASYLSRFPQPNLRSINIACSPLNLFGLMHQAPSLRKCLYEMQGESPIASQQNRIVLTQLDHLEVDHPAEADITSFFEFLTLPALQCLDICPQVDAQCLVSFLERSKCTLKTLSVAGGREWTIPEFESILSLLPKISGLYLHGTLLSSTVSQIFRLVFASSTVAKSITNFQCVVTWELSDNWAFIPELFRPAVYSEDKRAMHIELFLSVQERQEMPWIPMEVIQLIQELEKQGWKWVIYAFSESIAMRDLVGSSLDHYEQQTVLS